MIPFRISVVMPTYNSENFINETFESLRLQTYTNWELIVSDDCSTDNTSTLVKRFADLIPQSVIYHQNDHNIGLAGNRNNAIKLANADWIALLDSDDLWTPTHLEDCVNLAISTNADLVHSGSLQFDSNTGSCIRTIFPSEKAINSLPTSLFDRSYCIQPSSIMFSLELFYLVGMFDQSLRLAEDLDFYFRCVRAGCSISYTGNITCRYRDHGVSLSKNHRSMAESVARAYQKHIDWCDLPRRFRLALSANAWSCAGRLTWRLDPSLAITYFDRSCRIYFQFKPFILSLLCRLRLLFRSI